MILIIAKLVVKAGLENDFIEITKPLIAGSNSEAGCIEYILYRDQKNASVFHFVEKWKDKDAVKAHQTAAHYVEAGPKMGPLLEDKEVSFHEPV